MSKLPPGLYHATITEALQSELDKIDASRIARDTLHPADVADRIALHISKVVEQAISNIPESKRTEVALRLARNLIAQTAQQIGDPHFESDQPLETGEYLTAIYAIQPDGKPQMLQQPLIPLLDTTLLTNAPGEPRVGSQVLAEIPSADSIDIVMAFIRRSGVRPMIDALTRHCNAGRQLRILTTTYTGSTEAEALDELSKAGAQVRLSYDETGTRLHAKAWLFHRQSGCSTAYVGSSNLTHSAQITGLEWNARFSALRNLSVIEKVASVFNAYWHSGDFVPYQRSTFEQVERSRRKDPTGTYLLPFEIRLEPFQERMLEQLELSRLVGHNRNLIVSATGTGKTVMAAVDYCRLRERLPRNRLLFIVHRKEILKQALATFRHALRDGSFGELWVDGERPKHFDHVFASIQSLRANTLEDLPPDHFDIVIVDEFHHAEAPSYKRVLDHLAPKELLGLTATPERGDGQPILHWFNERVAAEFRLWDAIDQQTLAPFAYYGVADDIDYRQVPWKRGTGYDVEGVTKLLTGSDVWARKVIHELGRRVDNPAKIRALGFCVSIDHARFMARIFNAHDIRAVAIWSDTPREEREQALGDLRDGKVSVIFSVDLFNEGVDVPNVDTLLMLRPTDSATLFLQQLGRGLRKHYTKSICTVLDFVGMHRKEFRFDRRLGTILRGSRSDMTTQIQKSFPFLPAGCHMELDRVAQDRVLENIKNAVPSQFNARVSELKALANDHGDVSLRTFLAETGLTLEDIYSNGRCWSDYRQAAGLAVRPTGPSEANLRRACGRMLHADDPLRLSGYQRLVEQGIPKPDVIGSEMDRRLLRMLVASMTSEVIDNKTSLDDACTTLRKHPQVLAELLHLIPLLLDRQSHMPIELARRPDTPLRVHARYTRIEIQAAFADGIVAKPPEWREGVKYLPHQACDVFVFTSEKNPKIFSEKTRYKDYAISPSLIHWESQSTTVAESETGLRYQRHRSMKSDIMIFARESTKDRAFMFLGPAEYVNHRDERPMKITWRLHHPLPGDIYQTLAAAVA